jgi:shikimate kinase
VADPNRPHLILVGLPGSGKSTVGKAVAERLGRSFLDFDVEIERRQGKTIAEIFGEKGEGHFRELERALTEELRSMGNMILAPGGGWVTNPEVVRLVRPPGRLVYLRLRPETALKRLGAERTTRPLLMRPDPLGEIRRLLKMRQAAYEAADHVVDVELLGVEEVIKRVSSLAQGVR